MVHCVDPPLVTVNMVEHVQYCWW